MSQSGLEWPGSDFAMSDFERLTNDDGFRPGDIRLFADTASASPETYDQTSVGVFSTSDYNSSLFDTATSDSSSLDKLTYHNADLFDSASPETFQSPFVGSEDPFLAFGELSPPGLGLYPLIGGTGTDGVGDLPNHLGFPAPESRHGVGTSGAGADAPWNFGNTVQDKTGPRTLIEEATAMVGAGFSPTKRARLTPGENRMVAGRAMTPKASLAGSSQNVRPKLRSASGPSKNTVRRSTGTAKERKERDLHNLVEKQYRSRLNAQYEGLMNALPAEMQLSASAVRPGGQESTFCQEERPLSKGEVLEKSTRYIQVLEKDHARLREENEMLSRNVERLCSLLAGDLGGSGV